MKINAVLVNNNLSLNKIIIKLLLKSSNNIYIIKYKIYFMFFFSFIRS